MHSIIKSIIYKPEPVLTKVLRAMQPNTFLLVFVIMWVAFSLTV